MLGCPTREGTLDMVAEVAAVSTPLPGPILLVLSHLSNLDDSKLKTGSKEDTHWDEHDHTNNITIMVLQPRKILLKRYLTLSCI